MECNYPRIFNGYKCPCGLCMACRINKRRMWTHRMILESYMHSDNSFLTLTYDDEHLPPDGSVNPQTLQLFLKRLRQAISPVKIRFYAVGEYGDKSMRPHYHIALFGYSFPDRVLHGMSKGRPLFRSSLLEKCWTYGFASIGELTAESAQYVGGYVVKKMTKFDDKRLEGRHPEFSRMSLKPGIGAPALEKILDIMTSPQGACLLQHGDVPYVLRHGSKILPLGRYMRSKLREMYGFSDEHLQKLKQAKKQELLDVLDDYFTNSETVETDKIRGNLLNLSPIEYSWRNSQRELNLEQRIKREIRTV